MLCTIRFEIDAITALIRRRLSHSIILSVAVQEPSLRQKSSTDSCVQRRSYTNLWRRDSTNDVTSNTPGTFSNHPYCIYPCIHSWWRRNHRLILINISTRTMSSVTLQPDDATMATSTTTMSKLPTETIETGNDDPTVVIIDNPCWGSPTSCDLQDLFTVLETHHPYPSTPSPTTNHTSTTTVTTTNTTTNTTTAKQQNGTTISKPMNILYESMDYIVLNKPPDLRMDGDYPSTVTKLLLYYYPPASLLSSSLSQSTLLPTKQHKSLPTADDTTTTTAMSFADEPIHTTVLDGQHMDAQNTDIDGNILQSAKNVTATTDTIDTTTALIPRFSSEQLQLLHRISTIARFCDVQGNELRPCHQLDYATSGVLLVARSKVTAARARTAFEDRNVHKMYTAVVLGHLQIPNHHHNEERYFSQKSIEQFGGDPTNVVHHWSYVTQRALQGTMEQLEYNYRKSRHRHQKVTFFGFLPDSNIFNRWQDRERTKHRNRHRKTHVVPPRSTEHDDTKMKKSKTKHVWNKKQAIDWDTIFEEVDRLCYDVKMALLKIKWDDLKKSESELDLAIVKKFTLTGQAYNSIARQNIKTQTHNDRIIQEALPTLPTFFRVKEEEVKVYNSDGTTTTMTDKNALSFYIFAPLAQDDVTNNFSMLLHPSQHPLCPYLPVGDPTVHDFKPSLTKCTIVHRTYCKESISKSIHDENCVTDDAHEAAERVHPVTIVQLEPRTGRRHQLRIHTALLGHPIAGDATYCKSDDTTIHTSKERTMVDRLCLHSTQLHIPDLFGPDKDLNITCESPFRYHETKKDNKNDGNAPTNFVTIDVI